MKVKDALCMAVNVNTERATVGKGAMVRVSGSVDTARVAEGMDMLRVSGSVDTARVTDGMAMVRVSGSEDPARVAEGVAMVRVSASVDTARATEGMDMVRVSGSVDTARVTDGMAMVRVSGSEDPARVAEGVAMVRVSASVHTARATEGMDMVRVSGSVDPARVTDGMAMVRVSGSEDPARVAEGVAMVRVSASVDTARAIEGMDMVRVSGSVDPARVAEGVAMVRVSGSVDTARVAEGVAMVRVSGSVDTARVTEVTAMTAMPLLFTLFELARNPQVQTLLREEIKAADSQGHQDITKLLNSLPLLKGAIKETLRLYPVGITVQRYPTKDVTLHNYRVPAGTLVQVGLYAMGRSSEVFTKPGRYDPERWLNKDDNGFKALAFGFGSRQCIGRRIAEMEMMLFLVHVLRNFQIDTVSKEDVKTVFRFILMPEKPPLLTFRPIS
ncbi:hypothetical protein NDU88_004636 [Pleurodeles waltl]|uniref:steroid 11beta-monooxygenase n=1 Tax=Pleurodeles waltl TaxID=8319 RepID=A0AAV7V1S9_PLEWA|nr:hypothetical protein NDU88_004636 [Pleurodeles waltl]